MGRKKKVQIYWIYFKGGRLSGPLAYEKTLRGFCAGAIEGAKAMALVEK